MTISTRLGLPLFHAGAVIFDLQTDQRRIPHQAQVYLVRTGMLRHIRCDYWILSFAG